MTILENGVRKKCLVKGFFTNKKINKSPHLIFFIFPVFFIYQYSSGQVIWDTLNSFSLYNYKQLIYKLLFDIIVLGKYNAPIKLSTIVAYFTYYWYAIGVAESGSLWGIKQLTWAQQRVSLLVLNGNKESEMSMQTLSSYLKHKNRWINIHI